MDGDEDFFSCSSSLAAAANDTVSSIVSKTGRDVTYSCGSCGYELNLSSCNRNTAIIGRKYGKTMKSGVLSFLCIDETRFTQRSKLRCLPYFRSKSSWGFIQRHTRLFCRKCATYVGIAYIEKNTSEFKSDATSTNWDGLSATTTYDIKICALRPSVAFSSFCTPVME